MQRLHSRTAVGDLSFSICILSSAGSTYIDLHKAPIETGWRAPLTQPIEQVLFQCVVRPCLNFPLLKVVILRGIVSQNTSDGSLNPVTSTWVAPALGLLLSHSGRCVGTYRRFSSDSKPVTHNCCATTAVLAGYHCLAAITNRCRHNVAGQALCSGIIMHVASNSQHEVLPYNT